MDIALRDASFDDAQAIAQIYAHYVLTTCASFEEIPPPAAEIATRMNKVAQSGLLWCVAEIPRGCVVGFAYAAPFHTRPAYRYSVEDSVYVDPNYLRRGVATALMKRLIGECVRRGYRQMVALIGDSANEASIGLHARLGFGHVGMLSSVGFKLGRWVDVTLMQLALREGAGTDPF